MVRVSGASPANQTPLRCDELEVGFIAMPTRLADCKLAFLDFGCLSVGLKMCRSRRTVIDGWLRRDWKRIRLLGRGFDLSGAPPWSPRLDGFRCWRWLSRGWIGGGGGTFI